MFEIKKYEEGDKIIWDNFIDIAKNGTFLFYRNYVDYHKDRFIDHSLVIYKKKKVLAVLPASENNLEIVSHGGLTFGGLVMHMDLRAAEVLEVFQGIIQYYAKLNFNTLIYKAVPGIFHTYPAEEDLYALFRNNATLIRRDLSSAIPLEYPIRFSESKKQSVTKCQNENIVVEEAENFKEYWTLLSSVLEKFGIKPVHTVQEIEYLKSLFPERIRLFEARKEGELLAGIVIYEFGDVIHTQYMANSNEGRNFGALDYINSQLINIIYKNKKYYSFGISSDKMGQFLNTGLIQQKEMMGARGITIDFYKIDLTL